MSNRKIDRVSRRKGRISWLLASAVALPVVVLVIGLSAATAHAVLEEGPSSGTSFADTSVAPPLDSPAVMAPRAMSHIAVPTATEEPPAPTPTTEPGALVFTGVFDATDPDCGGGTITLIGDPDPSDPLKVSVVTSITADGLTAATFNVNDFADPPGPLAFALDAAVDANGAFSQTVQMDVDLPPVVTVEVTFEGTFNFGDDPATVDGTLSFGLAGAAPLCVVDYSATFQPGPPPPTATPAATVAPSLPATGSSGGSGSGGALWAVVAGIVGLFALGTAGVASLRRRTA